MDPLGWLGYKKSSGTLRFQACAYIHPIVWTVLGQPLATSLLGQIDLCLVCLQYTHFNAYYQSWTSYA